MICESTYGVQSNEPRAAREKRFTNLVHESVIRGGRCLIPAFALGRAQELLLILDEYWQSRPQLHSVPIYYASALAKKCMAVYQTYVSMMNEKIRKQFATSNPFVFKHISNLRSIEQFDDNGPCVMMASPAMLQSGLSRELFEKWCTDKKNAIIVPGYVVEGTLAKHILSEPDDVPSMDGKRLPLRMQVEYISFSAHVDYTQNSEFIDEMKPANLVLVHGEANEMMRLKSALLDRYSEKQQNLKIFTPKNCEAVELYFRGEKIVKTIGALASEPPKQGHEISGILMGKDFQYHLMDSRDIEEFTEVKDTSVMQRQCVAYHGTFELVKYHLGQLFGGSSSFSTQGLEAYDANKDVKSVKLFDSIEVKQYTKGQLVLEWEGDIVNDVLADAVIGVILRIESHPVSVKITKTEHHHHHHEPEQEEEEARDENCKNESIHQESADKRIDLLEACLKAQFDKDEDEPGESLVKVNRKTLKATIMIDAQIEAEISLSNLEVKCDDEEAKERICSILQELMLTIMPVGEPWHLE